MGGLRRAVAGIARLPGVWAVGVLVAACTTRDDDADAPHARMVREIVPDVERATGLRYKQPPVVEERSRDEVRAFLEREFQESISDTELGAKITLYRRLGLIPDTLDLRQLMLDLLTEQVAGYYDPTKKVLYVVKEAPREQTRLILTHELIHALQDQYVNLDSILHTKGNDDRQVAAHAVMEGQATLEQMNILAGGDFVTRIPGGWERVREEIRNNQGSMPIFASAPLIVQETLIFPYLSGAEFVRNLKRRRPGRSPFDSLPVSTEQLMHVDAYFGRRDQPTEVTLPRPVGGTALYENTLGEFETRIFLFQHLDDQSAAVRGAAGWDGDRYVVVRTPRGDGIAWLTVWDSAVDAAEFYDLAGEAVARRFGAPVGEPGTSGPRVFALRDRAIRILTGEVAGRPAVLYTDVPTGSNGDLIDLRAVRLRE